jgi:hypothetical protein
MGSLRRCWGKDEDGRMKDEIGTRRQESIGGAPREHWRCARRALAVRQESAGGRQESAGVRQESAGVRQESTGG